MTIKELIIEQLPKLKDGYRYDISIDENIVDVYIKHNHKQLLLFYKKTKGEFNETVYKFETNYFKLSLDTDINKIKEELLNYRYKLAIEKRPVKPFNFYNGK